MFYNCTNLATIYVGEGWNTVSVTSSNSMFDGCTNLVGGMGTGYDANHIDKEYACIDRGSSSDQPGYFTGRFNKEIVGYGNSDGGYYLIASPIGTVNPEDVGGMTDNLFDLYRFNQSAALEWENWKDNNHGNYHFDLEPGRGYLYANSDDVTLSFTGTPIEDDTYDVTLTRDDNAVFAGWNLVGNPFAATAYIMGDGAFYTMNETGTELEANTTLTSIAPMEGIFVLAEEDGATLTFTTEEPSNKGAMLAINLSGGGPSTPSTGSGTGSTTAITDRAIVRFDEGQPLPKFQIRQGNTKIYIPMDGKEYAVVSAGRDGACTVSTMDVNFKAEHNGTYTLSFDTEGVTFGYLHLIDNLTGADIDLLATNGGDAMNRVSTYTFDANTTDYAWRFRLVFSICGDANGDNESFAFINNGNIIITEDMADATLQVVDVMGHIIVSYDGRTRCVPTGGMTPGVYVLRLIRGNDVRTQKIVIEK